MTLHQESGGTAEDRANEAHRIVFEMGLKDIALEPREQDFVGKIAERLEQYGSEAFVSPKQLFWLRDLKEKYL